jgi:hypothetical protein
VHGLVFIALGGENCTIWFWKNLQRFFHCGFLPECKGPWMKTMREVTFRRRFPFLQNWFLMILKPTMPCRGGIVLDSFRLFIVIQTVSLIFDCHGFLLQCRCPCMESREKTTPRRRFPLLKNWFLMILKPTMPCRSGSALDSFRLFRVIQTVSQIFDCYGFLPECRGLPMKPREKWHSGAGFLFYRTDFCWFWSLLCPTEVALP